MTSEAADQRPGVLGALAVFLRRRALVMLALGFASGLPNLLIFDTLSAWLRDAGLSLEVIAVFSLATLAYSLKFLWAPLVDRTQVQRGFGDYSAYLWVAEGQGEIALSTTVKAWDVAAIKAVVEEAGGRLTDLDGATGIYGSTVFASNGLLHDAALAALRGEA